MQKPALKKHVPSFSKNRILYENIKVFWLKKRLRILQESFKPEFKPMIENLQERIHQEKCKQSKRSKISASTRWEIEFENCSKTFCKIFGRQNMKN